MTIIKHAAYSKTPRYVTVENDELIGMATTTTIRPHVASRQLQFKKCKKMIMLTLAFAVGFTICAWFTMTMYPSRKVTHILYVKTNELALHVADPKFLSVGLDSSVIAEGFKNFNMSNVRLRNMISNLSPGYLRVGGTLADRLRFDPLNALPEKVKYAPMQDGGACSYEYFSCVGRVAPNFTLSGKEWLQLYDLAHSNGFTIIFDLNALTRYDNRTWNYTNAKEIIDFSHENKMDLVWELGNEPNSFQHVFNYSVDAVQLAEDFRVLKEVLRNSGYENPAIVGPSVTRPRPENVESMEYLRKFLANGGGNHVHAITFHQYYFNGRTATSDQFLNPDVFNLLVAQTDLIEGIVSNINPQLPIWLGETAAAYGGGAPGFNNRYIGTFIWLDKLGVAAKMGLDVVVRQSIFKGFYALIDGKDYQPTPDYWISVLYKKLVGPEVLPCYSTTPAEVRLYCHCVNKQSKMFPAVTIYGLNMKSSEAVIRLQGFANPYYMANVIYSFVLTAHGTLLSKDIDLNSKKLELGENGELPVFKPHVLRHEEHVVMPPYSTAFFVIPTHELLDSCRSLL